MLKHFSDVVRSDNPPSLRAMSFVAAQLSGTVEDVLTSTSKFMEDVLGSKLALQTAEERNKSALMHRYLGDDPELAPSAGSTYNPAPPVYVPDTSKVSRIVLSMFYDLSHVCLVKLLEVGTPVLALHRDTGDHFRATVLRDHGDGYVAVQYTLVILGECERLSKKDVMTLSRGSELERMWHEVSKAVGEDGLVELVAVASDAAGKISHNGLIAWLQSRGMGELEKKDKHMLLADLDRLCKGAIDVSRFKSKLRKFRAKAEGIQMHRTVTDRHAIEEKDEFQHSVKDIKEVEHVDEVTAVLIVCDLPFCVICISVLTFRRMRTCTAMLSERRQTSRWMMCVCSNWRL